MIYRFIIISDEVDDFMREIQIDADATFLDFHKAIQQACDYKDGEMTSFTICENGWEKCQEITLEEMDTDSDQDSYVMADTHIGDMVEEERQHLLYTFDPLADRCFFIELAEIITGKSLKEPKLTRQMVRLRSRRSTSMNSLLAILSTVLQIWMTTTICMATASMTRK